jgi:competence protein ComEC
VLDCAGHSSTESHDRFLDAARAHGATVRAARVGDVFDLGAGAKAEVVYAGRRSSSGTEDDQNNESTVVRLTYGRMSFLFTGDIQEEGEMALLRDASLPASTVLKAPHHGSMDASLPAFLGAVRPAWAVISAGHGNPFGHPHDVTLARLKQVGARVLRTDEMGTITMHTDGRRLAAEWTHRNHTEHVELTR